MRIINTDIYTMQTNISGKFQEDRSNKTPEYGTETATKALF